jgi:hypothetical protein
MKQKTNMHISDHTIPRRKFLKQATMSTLGLAITHPLFNNSLFSQETIKKSKVVLVLDPQVIDKSGKVQYPILKKMLKKAITELTGKTNLKDAWSQFIPLGRPIGIKLNTLGLTSIRNSPLTHHYSAITSVLVEDLKQAGIAEKDLIIWDRSEKELINAGLSVQKSLGKVRIFGVKSSGRGPETADEYDPKYYPIGDKKVRLCRILTDQCDSLISIPILKHHQLAGITGSLKSHFGSIDNPGQFHSTRCVNPGIPELNTIPIIRKKQKLIIADCLLGLFHGGPWWNPKYIWPYGGIVVGTDPVAVDTVLLDIMDKKRISQKMVPLKQSVQQLKLSEKLGIGGCNPNQIDLKTIKLS